MKALLLLEVGGIALATVVGSRFQGLGARTGTALAAASTPARCQEIVDQAVAEALHELADAAGDAKGKLGLG